MDSSSYLDGRHTVRWAPDGTITALATPAGTAYCTAETVNDNGVAAGHCSNSLSISTGHAVRWAPDGTATDLGTLPGDVASSALKINRDGTIVGWSRSPISGNRAVRRNSDGSISELPSLPGGATGSAEGINDSGDPAVWAPADTHWAPGTCRAPSGEVVRTPGPRWVRNWPL